MMPLLMADGLVQRSPQCSRRSLCRGAAFAGSCLALPALAAMKSYSPAEAAGAASRLRQSRSALDEVKAAVDAKQFDQALTLLQSQPLAGFEADCTMLVQSSVLDVEDKKVPRASDFPPAVGPEGRHVLTHARSPPLAACPPPCAPPAPSQTIGTIRRYGVGADVQIMLGGLANAATDKDAEAAQSFTTKATAALDEILIITKGYKGLRK